MKNDKYALRELTPRMAPSRGHITLGRVTQRGWVVYEPPHDHRGEAIMDGRRSAFLLVVIGVLGETSPVIRTPSACLKNVGVSGLSVWLTRRRLGGKAPWLGPSLPPPLPLPLLNTPLHTASVMAQAAAHWRLPNSGSAQHPALPGGGRGGRTEAGAEVSEEHTLTSARPRGRNC